jgi:hypothetical protein
VGTRPTLETLPTWSVLWHLDRPWWKADGRHFAVTPREVLLDPRRHAEQFARTLNADLRFPLHITYRAERWLILDGIHGS